MRAQKKDRDPILHFVKSKRPRVQPNPGFWTQLGIWENCGFDVYDGEGREKRVYREWKEGAEREMRDRVAGYV
jgi:hypothetical protein